MLYLTEHELVGITGKVRPSAQLRWLRSEGFIAKRRADGSVLVSRRHYEEVMGGANSAARDRRKRTPNFGALARGA